MSYSENLIIALETLPHFARESDDVVLDPFFLRYVESVIQLAKSLGTTEEGNQILEAAIGPILGFMQDVEDFLHAVMRQKEEERVLLGFLGELSQYVKPRRQGSYQAYHGLTPENVKTQAQSSAGKEFSLVYERGTGLYTLGVYH